MSTTTADASVSTTAADASAGAAIRSTTRAPTRPYLDPYLAGIGVGLALLAAFVFAQRGLGVSGAFATAASVGIEAVAPERAAASPFFRRFLADAGGAPFADWIVVEVFGIVLGGVFSALLAGRLRLAVERGPRIGARARMAVAFGGGAIMGFGAMLARGCTSGLVLTGGALLAVGAWVFVLCAFAAGYLVAPLVRRQWT